MEMRTFPISSLEDLFYFILLVIYTTCVLLPYVATVESVSQIRYGQN